MSASDEPRYGHQLIHTRVVGNADRSGLARVMVQVPWIDAPVAAQVATPMAGNGRGTFFIPQEGDDVLVLVGDPPDQATYVIGSLWTSRDVPPRREADDAANVQLIRTPSGHEVELNDKEGTIVVTTSNDQQLRLSKDGILLRAKSGKGEKDAATLELKSNGDIVIRGASLAVEVEKTLDLTAKSIGIDADDSCSLKGSTIHLNDP